MPKYRKKITANNTVSKHNKIEKKKPGCGGKVEKIRKEKKVEKSYSIEMMTKAMTAAGSTMTLREASKTFGVPKSTLSLKMRNLIPLDCKKGPPTVFNSDEEKEIENWIIFCADKGFSVNKNHLLNCIQNYLIENKKKNPFTNNRPGKHWLNAFIKRHPLLAQRIARNLTSTRAPVTENDLQSWFFRMQSNFKERGLLSIGPERIFILDESTFMIVPKENTVLTKKGAKMKYQIVSASDKACITTLITASASGEMAPPMIMFDRKTTLRKNVLNHIPRGWSIGHTENSWMSAERFYYYIKNVFFKWLKENNYNFPVLLYVNGRSSHCTLSFVKFCKENQIELVLLYPDTLDKALFYPLKDSYTKELEKYKIDNKIVDFKKWMFVSVLKSALENVDFTNTIQNGFRASGLYPFDPDIIDNNTLNKTTKEKSVLESCDHNNRAKKEIDFDTQQRLDLLKIFETEIIPPSTLDSFKIHEFKEAWTGEIQQKGLFESWKKLKQLCGKI